MKTISILITLLFFTLLPVYGEDLTFIWEPSPSDTIIGYGFYYGQEIPAEGKEWAHKIDVGNVLTTTLDRNSLAKGTWYFAVTAYNETVESDYSNIVDYERKAFTIIDNIHESTVTPLPPVMITLDPGSSVIIKATE